mmetsp:Transcript_45770/g.131223  ORF Transcript_45770/g.131223 Transcript_45770/m.131223 type:complete len:116 (+) Transcript_45770:1215-1562(+)
MWALLRRAGGLTMFDDFQGSCVEAFVQSRPFARAGISACHHTVAGIALDPQFGFSVQSKYASSAAYSRAVLLIFGQLKALRSSHSDGSGTERVLLGEHLSISVRIVSINNHKVTL